MEIVGSFIDFILLFYYFCSVLYCCFYLFKLILQGGENVGVALLTYPVLMASDILLYQVVIKACNSFNRA